MTTTNITAPEDAGVDPAKVTALTARVRREIDEGVLPACQFALARNGGIVAFETFGDATNDTRFIVFSCTKGLINAAVWLFLGDGSLGLDQPVAEIVPEFAANGKEAVTVEHILRHLGGFPFAFLDPYEWDDRDARMHAFASWTLDWEPGTKYWYHPLSGYYVLAEIIERLAARDYRLVLRERILGPLGLHDLELGVTEATQHDIASLQLCGAPPSREELLDAWGISELPSSHVPHSVLLPLGDARLIEIGVPSANGVSTAADLALLYQALLHNTGGLWHGETLSRATSDVQSWPDEIGRPTTRALGVQINGDHGYSGWYCFGKTNSPTAFGHDGAGGMIAWADPATGLSFSYLTNGLDDNLVRQKKRGVGLSSRAAACLLD